jgi:hypothetical protein
MDKSRLRNTVLIALALLFIVALPTSVVLIRQGQIELMNLHKGSDYYE